LNREKVSVKSSLTDDNDDDDDDDDVMTMRTKTLLMMCRFGTDLY